MNVFYKKQSGLSLVELMISITLGLVLMAGVIQVFLSSRVVFSTQQAMSRAQENGRLGMELMSEDIRMAGYWGCTNRGAVLENDLPGGFWNQYVLGDTPNAVQGMLATDINGLAPAPIADSQALVLRYADSTPVLLTQEGGVNTLMVSGTVVDGCVGDLCVNKPAVISNCVAARVFMPTAIDASGAGGAQISHAGTWDPDTLTSIHDIFYPGAEVMPVNTVVFYLANNVAGIPSLFRYDSLSATAVEVIEGIERINFSFGIDGNYFSADAVGNGENIGSIRVDMLIQGGEQNVLADDQSYLFAGEQVIPSEPKRLYQVFTSTIAVRSRLQ